MIHCRSPFSPWSIGRIKSWNSFAFWHTTGGHCDTFVSMWYTIKYSLRKRRITIARKDHFLLHERQEAASFDHDGESQNDLPWLPPLEGPCKEVFLQPLKLTSRVMMCWIAGQLHDIDVVVVLTEGMPTKPEHMWNTDQRSSLAIGDIGFPFNTANLQENGYLLSSSVVPANNARITPKWTENDW